jgi:iron complex outermembrane recepter protein
MSRRTFCVLAALGAALLPTAVRAQSNPVALPEIDVVSPTPLPATPTHTTNTGGGHRTGAAGNATATSQPGTESRPAEQSSGLDRDKVPAMVTTVGASAFERSDSMNVTDTLMQRVPGAATSDVQGNSLMQDFRYRGFAASPLQGTPQGIAVYMNGIRLNEAFGDTVNWDLIPSNAIDRADVWSSNPLFGLNALGGAISMQMKNGFTFHGVEAETMGGSYGRISGALQYGAQQDNTSVYVAVQGLKDDGWRYQSPTDLTRLYGDAGWRGDRSEVHLVAAAASNFFGVVGPTPIQLIDQDYKSVFTWPQTTLNQMGLVALNGNFAVSNAWSIQSNLYMRKFDQAHIDGNDADVEGCSGSSSFPGDLCLQDDGFPVPPGGKTLAFRNQFAILDQNGNPIRFGGNSVPYGTIDHTWTGTLTYGGSLQATSDAKVIDHDNHFIVGGSVDRSHTNFSAESVLGFINPDLSVTPNPVYAGMGSIIHTLGNIGYGPVALDAETTYYGLYATDTFDVTPRLSATLGARLNVATIEMSDELGTSPGLNGSYTYQRLNPVTGLAYKIMPGLSAYGGYSEANRAPTPLELGCSNPNQPCLIEGFLVSDPPLQQVVARTVEGGLRGDTTIGDGKVVWKAGLFRTSSTNDIINVASVIAGRGVFQNVPATRRQGVEAGVEYHAPKWLLFANYSYTDATYQFSGSLSSPNNPMADANGDIFVMPGDKIPGIPLHQFKTGAEYAATEAWKIGADLVVVGSQYYVGDDSNQNPKLPAYSYVNLHSSYQVTKEVQVFGLVNNVFNQKFATYGTFFDPTTVTNAISTVLTDQRTVTPSQPLSVYLGLRAKL